MPDISHGCDVFVAQANFITGGIVVTGGLHHAAGDVNASFMVINRWTDHCKAVQNLGAPPVAPPPELSNRNLHQRIWAKEGTGKVPQSIDQEIWRLLGLDPSDTDLLLDSSDARTLKQLSDNDSRQDLEAAQADRQQRSMKSAIFYKSPSNFTTLQKDCVHGGATHVSGTHAICGLVWRSIMKAHGTEMAMQRCTQFPMRDEDITQMDIPLDGRSGFSNSSPQMYLGNHKFHLQSSMTLSALASIDNSIASVASMICENMRQVDAAK